MRSSLLTALLCGTTLSGCFFAPIDSALLDQNPTYPDGGRIPIDGGTQDNNNQTGAGIVSDVGVSGLTSSVFNAGDSFTLSAVARDVNGAIVSAGVSYSWSAEPAGIVTVDNANTISATIRITGTPTSDTGATVSLIVHQGSQNLSSAVGFTVRGTASAATTQLRIGGAPETLIVGQQVGGLFIQGLNSNGDVVETIQGGTWFSSSSDVVSVTPDNDGTNAHVIGVGGGHITISVSARNLTSPSISIVSYLPFVNTSEGTCSTNTSLSLTAGNSRSMFASVSDGVNCFGASAVTWASSDTSKATVSPAQGGSTTVTAVAAGSANIVGIFSGVNVSVPLTVTAVTQNPAQRIVEIVSSAPNCSDDSQATGSMGHSVYVAAVTGASMPCNQASGFTFTWSSDNTDSATVEADSQGSARATIFFGSSSNLKTHIRVHGVSTTGADTFDAAFEIIHG